MSFFRTCIIFLISAQMTFFSPVMGQAVAQENKGAEQPSTPEANLSLPSPTKPHKSPALSVFLSLLLPGAGHAYLGDWATAGGIFGLAVLGVSVVAFQTIRICSIYKRETGNDCFLASSGKGERELLAEYYRKDPLKWLGPLGMAIVQNDWFYGMYAAYRDARINNNDEGYKYRMPTESLADLASAPFSLSVLKKPEVWGGLLGTLGLGLGLSFLVFPHDESVAPENPGFGFPLIAFPVGLGEEALFRGYLQPSISEWATPWGGITLSSLLFGGVHFGNAKALRKEHQWRYYAFVMPFISGLGFYFGWLTKKNTSLKESVAIHTWYDFTLFAISAIGGSVMLQQPQFTITIPL